MSSLFFGAHVHVPLKEAAPMHPPAPRGICGLDGCVFLAGHRCDHSWMRPFDRNYREPAPIHSRPEEER